MSIKISRCSDNKVKRKQKQNQTKSSKNQAIVMLEHFTFSSCFEQICKGLIMTSYQLIFNNGMIKIPLKNKNRNISYKQIVHGRSL